jgi:hypothetical protein
MASCLDNIISVKDVCAQGDEPVQSLSGLDLFDAPEISLNALASIAPAEYTQGMALARAKVALAVKLIGNDLRSVLAANNVMQSLAEPHYESGRFNTLNTFVADGKDRGVVLYRNNKQGSGALRKLKIYKVRIYPTASHEVANLIIKDEYTTTTYPVELVGDQINEFDINYIVQGGYARVYLNDVSVQSNTITCFTGCGGTMPNKCGYVKGFYNGKDQSSKEGYGIQLDFGCYCDYNELMCALAPTYIGELVWLRSRELLLEERLRSDRLNNFVVYNTEETKLFRNEIHNEYIGKWQTFAGSLLNIIKSLGDSCLQCKGVRWVTNI